MPRKNQQPEMQTAFQLNSDPFPSRQNKQVNVERCDFVFQACRALPGGDDSSGPSCPPHAPTLELFPGWWLSFRM